LELGGLSDLDFSIFAVDFVNSMSFCISMHGRGIRISSPNTLGNFLSSIIFIFGFHCSIGEPTFKAIWLKYFGRFSAISIIRAIIKIVWLVQGLFGCGMERSVL
jgi:hypothetical protein